MVPHLCPPPALLRDAPDVAHPQAVLAPGCPPRGQKGQGHSSGLLCTPWPQPCEACGGACQRGGAPHPLRGLGLLVGVFLCVFQVRWGRAGERNAWAGGCPLPTSPHPAGVDGEGLEGEVSGEERRDGKVSPSSFFVFPSLFFLYFFLLLFPLYFFPSLFPLYFFVL